MKNILVMKLGALGDFILSLSAMAGIREHHANDHISLLTTAPFVDIAQRSGYFDQIIVDPRPGFFNFGSWMDLRETFNTGQFDRVYDLQMNDRTTFYYKLFRKKPEWSGRIKKSPLYFNDPDMAESHVYQKHKKCLQSLGVETKAADLSWMEIDIDFFKVKKPYVLFVPGSAPQHPQKRWPVVKYAALAKKLTQYDYQVCILGSDAEYDIAQKIQKICPEVKDFTGQTSLYDIYSLARDAEFSVGNDTGPMHLISQSGCPVLSLFSGTTNPALSAPIGDDVTVLQAENIADISMKDVVDNLPSRTQDEERSHVG